MKLFKCIGPCRKSLPAECFYTHSSRSTGLQSHCKERHRLRVKYQRNRHLKESLQSQYEVQSIECKPYVLDMKMMNYTKNRETK
jgi:hypothetical protein